MPTVQVRRGGSAPKKRAAIDGVQLDWIGGGNLSHPKELPAGQHLLQWYAEGKTGDSFEFEIVQPPGTGVHLAYILTSDGWDSDSEVFTI